MNRKKNKDKIINKIMIKKIRVQSKKRKLQFKKYLIIIKLIIFNLDKMIKNKKDKVINFEIFTEKGKGLSLRYVKLAAIFLVEYKNNKREKNENEML